MNLQAFGLFLREAREQREISLDEAVKILKIQKRILESFEQGDFSQGGSPVQVRGMLRNYARFLRLEEDVVLQHYETALIPPKTGRWRKRATEESQAVKPATLPRRDTLTIPLSGGTKRNTGPRFAWLGRVLYTLVGFGLVGLIIVLVGEILNRTPPPEGGGQPTLAAQISTVDPTLATATYTATYTPLPDVPDITPTTPFLPGSTVELTFVQSSWARVVVDGDVEFEGIGRPGNVQPYTVQEGIEVTLANAAAMELSVNGRSQTIAGERGQQVIVLFNATGLQVIHPGSTPTLDASRIISPESLVATETPDTALTPSVVPTFTYEPAPTLSDATPIGADLIPTDSPSPETEVAVAALNMAVESSSTPDAALLGAAQEPTLTPFNFMAPAAVTEATTTAVEITPDATLTPTAVTPTAIALTVERQGTAQPTLTPFNFMAQTTDNASQPTVSSATVEVQQAPTQSQAAQAPSQVAGVTPVATTTPTMTLTATATATQDSRPTAIVPLRITQAGLPTRKAP